MAPCGICGELYPDDGLSDLVLCPRCQWKEAESLYRIDVYAD